MFGSPDAARTAAMAPPAPQATVNTRDGTWGLH
jgi:hypothetical protein